MESNFGRAVSIARALVHELRAEKVTFMAGSIAYHAFVSLLPLLLLVIGVLSAVGNPPEEVFVSLAGAVLTENTGEALLNEISESASAGVSLLSAAVLVWGALRIFRGLDTAFSDIYETESQNTITDQFSDAVVVFVTFGLAIAAAWGIDALLDALGAGPIAWLIQRIVLICGLMLTFFPMYYIFPDTDVSTREVIPGLVVAAVGLVAFVSVFQFYAAFKAGGDSSIIVGIIVLLTWLYFSGLIVLVGAAVNAVLSNRSHDVDIDPVVGNHTTESKHAATDRKHLVASLHEVAANADTDELVISSDDVTIRLPPPRRATVDTDGAILGIGEETVGIELRWTVTETKKASER